MTSNAERVKEFTEGAIGKVPNGPLEPLSRERAEFIVAMVCSEMVELLQTVTNGDENPVELIKSLCDRDHNANYVQPAPGNTRRIVAEQADAMVDAMYYMYDTAARMGLNLDGVFNVVQEANMAKRDPVSGEFRKRDDGKILKPPGWQEPNIEAEIGRQQVDGAWST